MRPHPLPLWALVKAALAMAVLASVLWLAAPVVRRFRLSWRWDEIQTATLVMLRSERLAFLVTDRLVSQLSVTEQTGNLLLGRRDGVVSAPLSIYYGIDVASMTPSNITREGGQVVVTLPEPRVLDLSVDLQAMTCYTRRSGLVIMADQLAGRDQQAELRTALWKRAHEVAADPKLLPPRDDLVRRLNQHADMFSKEIGVPIRFR